MKSKKASESASITTEIVLPNDTNNLDNLMGGRLLHWMDIAAAISSHRHCGRIVVTASVNNVSFNKAIPRGSIVTLEAKVSRAFNSSMEVFVDVWMENGWVFSELLICFYCESFNCLLYTSPSPRD